MKTKITSIRMSVENFKLLQKAAAMENVPASNWIIQQALIAARKVVKGATITPVVRPRSR
jgi:uncharacterized protein (DUF1778 family)